MAKETAKKPEAPAPAALVADFNDEADWVYVTHESLGDAAPGRVTREWLTGWGEAQGWSEVDTAKK